MLASFLVFLKPRRTAPLGRTVGRSLHALLLNMIRQVDPALSEELHADTRSKPFTVSMLQGRLGRDGGRAAALPTEVYRVRYTVMTDPVFRSLSQILLGKVLYREPVIIDGAPYDITDISVEASRSDGWAGLSSYEQVMEGARPEPRITLEFASPTTFRQGEVNLLFPLPASVFGSYWRRWQAFAPLKLDDEALLAFVEESVVVERYDLATRIVSYGEHQFNGCVGTCQYRVLGNNPAYARQLNALADFALFCGTGQKTTQGLGQTRRIFR
ncbi:MAG: CRISPR system precrRNA processing endoribonuclease RAMP protein Cas6 [Anaerolineae bacterium]